LIVLLWLNKQDGIEKQKMYCSYFRISWNTLSNWFHTAKFNFLPNSEMDMRIQGYFISKTICTLILFLGLGAEYASKTNTIPISFYFKITMVLDQRLANQGAFGVKNMI
jgi:hypothetical protein